MYFTLFALIILSFRSPILFSAVFILLCAASKPSLYVWFSSFHFFGELYHLYFFSCNFLSTVTSDLSSLVISLIYLSSRSIIFYLFVRTISSECSAFIMYFPVLLPLFYCSISVVSCCMSWYLVLVGFFVVTLQWMWRILLDPDTWKKFMCGRRQDVVGSW